jgi:hypothetical protein
MKTLLATTALVLCTLGTATAQAAGIEFAPARLMFDPTPVAEWDQRPDSEAAPTTITLTQSRQWYWAHYRATHPLTTTVAQVSAYEEAQQQQVEIVQATRCPVLRDEPDYDWCNQQAALIPFAECFSNVPVFVMHVPADGEAAPMTLTQSRQWYWAHYRATHPLTTTVAQVQAYEQREAAPVGLVGTPYPPGIEQQPGGIGSDYVAQAKADRAVLAAKDAAVLSAHAEAKPKRTRTHKH